MTSATGIPRHRPYREVNGGSIDSLFTYMLVQSGL